MQIKPLSRERLNHSIQVNKAFPYQSLVERMSLTASIFKEKLISPKNSAGVNQLLAIDEKSQRISGNTGLYCYNKDEAEAYWLAMFCVDTAFRGQGIGKKLLNFSIDKARSDGKKFLQLYTSNDPNEAAAQIIFMDFQLLSKPLNKQIIGLIVVATAVSGAIAYYGISQFGGRVGETTASRRVETPPPVTKVTALGRLEPEAEIIRLSAPLALDGDRVAQLLVKQGDRVEKGQVVAILDSRDRLQDALLQAQKQHQVAVAKLAQVKAGAKAGEIAAQKATIERLQAQLQGDKTAQQETIARIEAQWQGDKTAQQETIARIEAQWQGDKTAQIEAIARIQAQWQGDKTAQQATIKKLEAELNNALAEYQRYQQLHKEGAISNSTFDSKSLSVETAKQQLSEAKAILDRINTTASKQLSEAKAILDRINTTGSKQLSEAKAILDRINTTGSKQLSEAKVTLNRINATGREQVREAAATLDGIAEVRPTDVQAAQAEVENAIAATRRAQTDLNQAYIKAPIAGQILKINTRVGEKIGENGIADLAQTDQMVAVAEIYQTDIGKIKMGQPALITGQAFAGELRGIVSEIGLQVNRQNVFSNQPGENLDRRVIEIKIRLNPEDSKRVAGLTNLQVQTAIEL
uniref:GNAT family N-acetyltransferase n=2 Tax=Microseira wollei TaxID=467598 RepID=UPI001CFEBC47|nr:GNAT family N-acetyltransferase [Microseira wollei]